ncbi:MAG TPA: hypothetical protein VNG31_00840 [Candidatus Baltobacteraceae bacterium]|nr:hypothetical protein [Candidatus Baltobacteraceae bacterium]
MRLFALCLLASALAGTTPLQAAHTTRSQPSSSPRPSPLASAPEALYSRRVLRQARLLVQMRLLQLRAERLDCIRETILARLPPELRPETLAAGPKGRGGCDLDF